MKQGKIILLISGVFFFIAIVAIVSMFRMFWSNVDSIGQRMTARQTEAKRIADLPEIKGVVYAEKEVIAPFSGKPAALVLLNGGYRIAYGDPHSKRGLIYRWEYEPRFSVMPNSAKIKIGNVFYDANFTIAILPEIKKEDGKHGFEGFSFSPNHFFEGIISNNELKRYTKILYSLQGQNEDIDIYIKTVSEKRSYQTPSTFQGFMVRDVLFKNGDTIVLKGKLRGNKIIPLD
jgi:hypothetical protein